MLQPIMLVAALSSPAPPPATCPMVEGLLDGTLVGDEAAARLAELGQHAIDDVLEALSDDPRGETAVLLLEVLTYDRDSRAHRVIRPYLFDPEPRIAAIATRAMALAAGGRSRRILEQILVAHRSWEQTLAALEGLARIRVPASFDAIGEFAADAGNDRILRAEAVTVLSLLDPKKTRKWIKKNATTDPYLQARVTSVSASLVSRR